MDTQLMVSDEKLSDARDAMLKVEAEVKKVIFGLDDIIKFIVMTIFAREHVLLDGIHGTAKTMLALALARVMGGDFVRVQGAADFTPERFQIAGEPDENGIMKFWETQLLSKHKKLCIILVDEITRFTTQTQAFWFEVMAERQITRPITTIYYPHARIIATKNKIVRGEGNPIPAPMFDRFLVNLEMRYPDFESEVKMLSDAKEYEAAQMVARLTPLMDPEKLETFVNTIHESVRTSESLRRYIVSIGEATRFPSRYHIVMEGVQNIDSLVGLDDGAAGLSPRALTKLKRLAKVAALRDGKDYVTPEHIRDIAPAFMPHRIVVNDRASSLKSRGTLARDFARAVMGMVPSPQGFSP